MLKKLLRRQVNLNTSENLNQSLPTDSVSDQDESQKLNRTMGLASLVFLCISNSVGTGVYILTGIASNPYAGPYVSLSYVFAGIACLMTAFCYAEFSSRVKDISGSSYSFVYYSLGEFIAFSIGWLMFTSAIASMSSTAITWSQYLDALTNNSIRSYIIDEMHLGWPGIGAPFSSFLDISAICLIILLFIVSLWGIEIATIFNNILACVNIALLLVITIAGFVYGNFDNLTKTEFTGGFQGIIQGSSIVFYAFIGFETSTFAINESINPARNIPLSLIVSIIVITLTYVGASLSLNLMQPFDEIDTKASYPKAFNDVPWMKLVVEIGPIISLSAAFYIAVYGLTRMFYSMSKDGLIFNFLSKIHPKTKVPHLATYVSLVLTLILTLIFDINNLIGFANIAGFLTYISIGVGLLIVRYFHDDMDQTSETGQINSAENEEITDQTTPLLGRERNVTIKQRIQNKFATLRFFRSKYNALYLIIFLFFSNIILFGLLNYIKSASNIFLIIALVSNLIVMILLSLFKETDKFTKISFRVPFVPLVPILVIMLNAYLLMSCEATSWIISVCILLCGLPVYFFYGMKNSRNSTN